MTTLATLRAQCRLLLASATAWPDDTLDGYIQDAIRFYSTDFPRILVNYTTATKDVRTYDLPGGNSLRSILRVVYDDETLAEVENDSDLLDGGGWYYAVTAPDDTTAADEDNIAGTLTIAPNPAGGEILAITYSATHRIPTVNSDTDNITVPQAHWEALIAFVDFRAHWQLESGEAVAPDPETMALAQLGDNARRAWVRYKEIISRILYTTQGQSRVIVWDNSRIY